jgi:hypothetical protein
VYGRDLGSGRWSTAIEVLTGPSFTVFWLTFAVLVCACCLLGQARSRRVRWLMASCLAWLAATVLVDAWIYGDATYVDRYRAVADVCRVLVAFGALCCSIAVVRTAGRGVAPISVLAGSIVLGLVPVLAAPRALVALADEAELNSEVTNAYDDRVDAALAAIGEAAPPGVAVVVSRVSDFEPAAAVTAALRHEQTAPQFLVVHPLLDGNDHHLLELLRDQSIEGHEMRGTSPLAAMPDSTFCVFLNADPSPIDRCGDAVRLDR